MGPAPWDEEDGLERHLAQTTDGRVWAETLIDCVPLSGMQRERGPIGRMLIFHGETANLDGALKANAVEWAEDPGQQAEIIRLQRRAHMHEVIRPGKDPTGIETERRCSDLLNKAQDSHARMLALPIIYAQDDANK